jgi:hypothetical protein
VAVRKVERGTAERLDALRLPAGWDLAMDQSSGRQYYFDWVTLNRRWGPPTEETGEGGPASMAGIPERTVTNIHWEVNVDHEWMPMGGAGAAAIRSAIAAGEKGAHFTERGFPYHLDLRLRVQKNLRTGTTRNIRPVVGFGRPLSTVEDVRSHAEALQRVPLESLQRDSPHRDDVQTSVATSGFAGLFTPRSPRAHHLEGAQPSVMPSSPHLGPEGLLTPEARSECAVDDAGSDTGSDDASRTFMESLPELVMAGAATAARWMAGAPRA